MAILKYVQPVTILAAAAFLLMPTAVFAPKALAVIFTIAALGVLVPIVMGRNFSLLWPPRALWFLILLGVIGVVSAFWSLTPARSVFSSVTFLFVLFGAAVLLSVSADGSEKDGLRIRKAIIVGGALGYGLLALELGFDAPIMRAIMALRGHPVLDGQNVNLLFNQGLSMAVLFYWPWLYALWRWRPTIGPLLSLIVPLVVFVGDADAPILAWGVGVATAIFLCVRFRAGSIILSVVVSLGVLFSPIIAEKTTAITEAVGPPCCLSFSGFHRLLIWQTAASHIHKHPILGSGFDTSRALYGPDDRRTMTRYDSTGKAWWGSYMEPIPLHPHNAALQVWLELGVLGMGAFIGALLAVISYLGCGPSRSKGLWASSAMFGTWLFIVLVGYGAWQGWWLGGVAVSVACMAGLSRLPPSPQKPV